MAYRALGMLLKPVLYRGHHVATVEKPDNSALLAYASQLARSNGRLAELA